MQGTTRTALLAGGLVATMAGLSFAAVPFYSWFCRTTGYGGTTGVATAAPEEGEILEDLIVAAHNDAKAKTEVLIQEKMKTLTGGLPLPPGLKLF